MKKILLFAFITLFMLGCDTKEEKQAYKVLRGGVLVDSTETHRTYRYGRNYYMFYQLGNDVWYMRRGNSMMREQPRKAKSGDRVCRPISKNRSHSHYYHHFHHYFHHHH